MYFSDNSLNGSLPASWGNFSKVQSLIYQSTINTDMQLHPRGTNHHTVSSHQAFMLLCHDQIGILEHQSTAYCDVT